MQKITEKVAALPSGRTFISLEFFPPKTEMGYTNLQDRIARMSAALKPLFVNVTWGAGGSTFDRSLELAELCQVQAGLTTCLHLTCTNMRQGLLDRALRTAKRIGIRNILALRGDPPRQHEYDSDPHRDEDLIQLTWAVDLVRYIRAHYGDFFCIGVAGYPEGHSDESNPLETRPEDDMPHLLAKINAGADFIMTQVFYDSPAYIRYEKLVKTWNGGAMRNVLIIPGLMPIQSASVLRRTAKLSHASIPDDIHERVMAVAGDDEEVKNVGLKVLVELIQDLQKSSHCRGFHFYTLNLERSVSRIIEEAGLGTPQDQAENMESALLVADTGNHPDTDLPSRRPSFRRENALTDESSSVRTATKSLRDLSHTASQSKEYGREATWDDFPNGRFGDPRSPAFGEIDGYGPSLHVTPQAARDKWGYPTNGSEIGKLFVGYLRGELDQLPWSEGPTNLETSFIRSELIALIEQRGWWTIASQPAVNAAPSQHPVFGWGPPRGFVFQKAFVEFLLPSAEWRNRVRPFLNVSSSSSLVSWYSSNYSFAENGMSSSDGPNWQLSFESSSDTKEANSVTWGAFPGKEIVSPTIIEELSFRAWAEEVFAIWADWGRCYSADSPTRRLLMQTRRDYTLVNIICHDFQRSNCLWEILMAA